MKEFLKRHLPVGLRRRLRRLGRCRWITKYRLMHAYGSRLRSSPLTAARFVLLDPEVESHSFEIENEHELAMFLAKWLNQDVARVSEAITVAKNDPVLSRDRGLHLTVKRRPPIGRRLSWFVVARLTCPRLIVETGIHDGLGSEVLLRALQLNEADGQPGRLISFDLFADTGWAVLPELRVGWQRVIGSTFDIMESTLADLEVDMLIRDTPPMHEHVRAESQIAARHAGPLLTVIDSAGDGAIPLQELSERMGGSFEVFAERTRNHVQRENRQAYARIPRQEKTCVETPEGGGILSRTTES